MPYFSWQGVTLHGILRKGTLYAGSAEELDTFLFKRDIALIKSTIVREPLFSPKISTQQISSFFRNLGQLLAAGVLLPEALTIVYGQMRHLRLQKIVAHINWCVQSGSSLSEALQEYPLVFNRLVIHMIYSGDEAGTLGRSLHLLSDYLDRMAMFKKQVRSAIIMPCITLGFFMLVAGIILIGILPRFVTMFGVYNQDLPYITACLMQLSAWISSWRMAALLLALGVLCGALRRYAHSVSGKKFLYTCLAHIPLLGELYKQISLLHFIRSLVILLDGGMTLPNALVIGCHSLQDISMRERCTLLARDVQDGNSLSGAMTAHHETLFGNDIIALVKVGEESGTLSGMLARVADCYQETINHYLALIVKFIQPVLMIILGLLILVLVIAVYVPLLQFSQCIR